MIDIDLRSDTVTQPSEGMRKAIAAAVVGDDVFGDDPTVDRLERVTAALLGKEAVLFVPSGTMANQLALLALTQSGDEVWTHSACHLVSGEQGAPGFLSRVQTMAVRTGRGPEIAAAIQKIGVGCLALDAATLRFATQLAISHDGIDDAIDRTGGLWGNITDGPASK